MSDAAYVLLVEDSAGDASIIQEMLAQSMPLEVRWVRDLGTATAALGHARPAMVLADLGLPDSSGMETLDALLHGSGPDVPVIVLTGDTDDRTGVAAIDRGAHDFLRKDALRSEALARCVRFALSSRRAVLAAASDPVRRLLRSWLAMAVVDVSGRILEVNAGLEQLVGFDRDAIVGTPVHRLAAPADQRTVEAAVAPPTSTAAPVEATLVRAGGASVAVRFAAVELDPRDGGDGTPSWVLLFEDLSAQRAAEAAVDLRGRLLDAIGEAVLAADVRGRLIYANDAARRLFALDGDLGDRELASVLDLSVPDLGRRRLASRLGTQRLATTKWLAGEEVDLQVALTPTADAAGVVDGWIVVAVDVTERTGMQQQLVHQAMHDGLTGLPNRSLLMRRVELMLERGREDRRAVGLLYLDVDDFKAINDTHGHARGDEVLRAIADLLRQVAGSSQTVARIGGDEFVVCCEHLPDADQVRRTADQIAEALQQPITVGGSQVDVRVSIGLALAEPDSPLDGATLLRNADVAMYHAKERGRGRVERFDEALEAEFVRRIALREALLHVPEDQLHVEYQPWVRLSTGELIGVEALLRWTHPVFGRVAPDEFIPIAEETGLILPLGRWVIERACAQLAAWRTAHPERRLTMSVNLSARQLSDERLVSFVGQVLAREGLEPAALCLEITETVLMTHADESAARLRRLKELGVRIAIDDFGTGYSSLAYLRRLPLDILKVDREFVRFLDRSPEDIIIVAAITRLAASLDLQVVGEGVETAHHRDELHSLGCDMGQGWLWSPAVQAVDIDVLLDADHTWEPARVPDDLDEDLLLDGSGPDVDEVVSVLRHELGSPLQVIKLYTDILRAAPGGPDDGTQVDALGAIGRSAHDIELLIRDLTDLRSLAEGTTCLVREDVDVMAVVGEVIDVVCPTAPDHTIRVSGRPCGVVACADPGRLRQVVTNLLTNAVRHTPAGTTVHVRAAVEDGVVELAVRDDGPGIPPEKVPLLFRRFAKLHRGGPGTGLGLYLCRGLARAHGGDLRYWPGREGGAEFVLTLPAARPAVVEGA